MAAAKFHDLKEVISTRECYCLNENPSFPFGNLFIGDETLQLKSDADGKSSHSPLLSSLLGRG